MEFFRFIAEGDEEVARSPYPRFALETTIVRLATLPKAMSVGEVLGRLEALERRLSDGRDEEALPNPRAGAEVESRPEENRSLVSVSDETKDDVWRKFVAFVMKEKKFLGSHLEQARPLELPPGRLMLGVGERHHLHYLQDPENLSSLKEFAGRFFSGEVAVMVSPMAATPPSRREEPRNSSESVEEPGDMVKEALRIFGGAVKGIKRENG